MKNSNKNIKIKNIYKINFIKIKNIKIIKNN